MVFALPVSAASKRCYPGTSNSNPSKGVEERAVTMGAPGARDRASRDKERRLARLWDRAAIKWGHDNLILTTQRFGNNLRWKREKFRLDDSFLALMG